MLRFYGSWLSFLDSALLTSRSQVKPRRLGAQGAQEEIKKALEEEAGLCELR